MPHLDPARFRIPGGPRADLVSALVVLVLTGVAEGQRPGPDGHATPPLILSWLLAGLVCAALPLRRSHPVAVGWCTVVGTGVYYLLSAVDGPLVLVPIVVLYGLASQGRFQMSVAMAAVMVISVGAGALAPSSDVTGTAVFMLTGWLIAVVALGAMRHGRVAYAEERARSRATQERLRIARELHDVIGHNLSMINIQASAALHRIDRDPGQAATALAAIKEGSKEGLRGLRTALGVLRQADQDAPTAPPPGLDRIGDLVTSTSLAGLDTQVERSGTPRPLPAAVDLAAYRIVQESLTNAAKHSGARHVLVRLHHDDEQLTLTIADDGGGLSHPGEAGGSGIAGMAERARALGGALTAGPGPEGGFIVRARLPLTDHDEPTNGTADDQDSAGGRPATRPRRDPLDP